MKEHKESPLRRFMVSEDTVPLEAPLDTDEDRKTSLETFKIYRDKGQEPKEKK